MAKLLLSEGVRDRIPYPNLQKYRPYLLVKSSKKKKNGPPFPSISIGIFKSTAHSYENEIPQKKFQVKIKRMKSSNDCLS